MLTHLLRNVLQPLSYFLISLLNPTGEAKDTLSPTSLLNYSGPGRGSPVRAVLSFCYLDALKPKLLQRKQQSELGASQPKELWGEVNLSLLCHKMSIWSLAKLFFLVCA